MGFPYMIIIVTISLILNQIKYTQTTPAPDYTTLVYQGCAKQQISDPNNLYSQSLSSLFSSLVQKSSSVKFFKSTTGGSGTTSISGLFQCRGDLSNADCYNCVNKIPPMTDQLCGRVMAARVQLLGCYITYQVSGFSQISGLDMLYKTCSRSNAAGSGFGMRRDSALTVMQTGLVKGNGFYTTNYESVYVLGQCEGDLSEGDCGQCVKTAVEKAQIECGFSLSAQVYLHKCFISYSYYPNGVPTKDDSFSSGYSSSGSRPSTGKTVAIIVGGTACVGFLIICVLFVRGLKKKDDDF